MLLLANCPVEATQPHVRVHSQVHALARLESGVGRILHTATTCLRRLLPSRRPPTCEEPIILDEWCSVQHITTLQVEATQHHVRVYSQVHALARLASGVGIILHTATSCLRRLLASPPPVHFRYHSHCSSLCNSLACFSMMPVCCFVFIDLYFMSV